MSTPLATLPLLLLDCQSSGASPRHGALIDLAWCLACGSQRSEITSTLVALPESTSLPKRVELMTGLSAEALAEAPTAAEVWASLAAQLQSAGPQAVALAHYSRFEAAWLSDLAARFGDGEFPLPWLCTHELAKRLVPDLPRRGLRALAGYLGHPLPAAKRSAEHVEATWQIWLALLPRLVEIELHTLEDLRVWLAGSKAVSSGKRDFPFSRERRLSLPKGPGVYKMRDAKGRIVYVGKATSLRSRVNSYYRQRKGATKQTFEMLAQVWDIDVEELSSPLEAAMREHDLIKELEPVYNVALRAGGRETFYVSPQLEASSSRDAEHGLGPLTDRGVVELFAQLRAGAEVQSLLSEELTLEEEVARDGLTLFLERHEVSTLSASEVSRVGRRVRLARAIEEAVLAAQEAARAENSQPGMAESRANPKGCEQEASDKTADLEAELEPDLLEAAEDDEVWDAERVARLLEGFALRFHQQLRRGRWLRLLVDSHVWWEGEKGAQHELEVRGGALRIENTSLEVEGLSVDDEAFDIITYDRLRVLTTELKRLHAAGRPLFVQLSTGVSLVREQLGKLFRTL
ncbi:MAG: hypothetical protein CO108_04230 [Deltaproteobacteria bacterium CG_4_9_14_3_um_filter_63_12]|nr:MAG: hypothetical protein CO108_04230 [Deltaproteobacteria bacterium CG_4_9_14_3_um_filter_63_12]